MSSDHIGNREMSLEAEVERLRQYLERIMRAEGAFSRDRLIHAENAIGNMQHLASRALAGEAVPEED